MELWLLVDTPGTSEVEVAVDLAADDLVAALRDALAARLGTAPAGAAMHVHRLGRELDASTTIEASGLRFGDRVTLAPSGWRLPTQRNEARTGGALVTLSVIGGPASGRRVPLGRGDHVIGRGGSSDIQLDDPTLSRAHVRLTVGDSSITVADAGSSNGTFVDGVRVSGDTTISIGGVIEAGHTLLRVDAFQPAAGRTAAVQHGLVAFNRPPRVMPPPADRTFRLAAPPSTPGKGRLGVSMIIAPLVVGVPMIALSAMQGNSTFLIMGIVSCLASPLLAVASWWEDRRSGRSAFRSAMAAFDTATADVATALQASLADEVARRRRSAPDAADLLDRAHQHRSNLWERRPDDSDFLHVELGWADLPSDAVLEFPAGGDEAARARAEAALAPHRVARNVPVVAELTAGPLGLCGDRATSVALARWAVLQLATLHSPRDVVIAAAVADGERDEWAWLSWLPHLRGPSSPVNGPHLAVGEADAAGLFEALNSAVKARRGERGLRGRDERPPGPAIVVLISDQLRLPRTATTRLLEDGTAAGVHTIWLGSEPTHVPGDCRVVVETRAAPHSLTLTVPATGLRLDPVIADGIALEPCRDAALALAPVKDVTAGGGHGSVPNSLNLLELLSMPTPTATAITERWARAPLGVNGTIGASAGGPFDLDLRLDGPHALVGGTTGAGKSELLQTVVAAIAADHPPNRVTFLLVDYKGGAAFKDCVQLPHTVGMVTDLDGHLVRRALVSLNAELRRREHLLRDAGVKDLLEMERRYPNEAPPALVLIVDEFATLAKELPDFVDGVVNVAQRGRSLGIHLILATQRPAGAINDNVRANTNLRIALRMNDQADSQDVINSVDAALLPRTLPGRAYVRTGQSELTEVQVAYVGGHSVAAASAGPREIDVLDLDRGQVVRRRGTPARVDDSAPTDLQLLVQSIGAAFSARGIAPPLRPWVEPLPSLLPFADFADEVAPLQRDGVVALGLADLPSEQRQTPWMWDLEQEGNLLVYGTSGAGKTTLLRSLVAGLAAGHSADDLHMYCLDFASRGLHSLQALPHVGAVVPGDDIERVQRVVALVQAELASRRERFAAVGASTLTEYRRATGDTMPRLVVLLDGYSAFAADFEKIDHGDLLDRLPLLVSEGRPLGVHWVLTADRRTAIGMTLGAAFPSRVVLRMPDDDDYPSLGLDPAATRGVHLPAGRGFSGPSVELQVPVVGTDPAGDAQAAAVERMAARLAQPSPGRGPQRISGMPADLDAATMPVGAPLSAVVGIRQVDLQPFALSLEFGNIFVAGPNRSGKSTALETLVTSMRSSTPTATFVLLAPRRSPLGALDFWTARATRLGDCDDLAAEYEAMLDGRTEDEPPIVIVVDDVTELVDTSADSSLERLARRGKECGLFLIAAGEASLARRAYGGVISELRRDRNGLLVQPDVDLDGDLLNVRVPRARPGFWVPGRAVAVSNNREEIVQIARRS